MDKMKFFILLSLMYMVCLSHQEDENCPKNITLWKEREAKVNCGKDKLYHCLRDEGERVKESCLRGSWIQPGFCPEFNSIASEIDVFLCKESMGKCPDATYWSNELYRYSACLKAVSIEQHGSKEKQNVSVSEHDEESDPIISIIVVTIIVTVVVIIVSILFVIMCCWRRSNRRQGDRESRKMEEMAKEADVVDSLIPLQPQDESNARLTSAPSDALSISKNHTQNDKDDSSLVRRNEVSISATTEVVNINSREHSHVTQKSTGVQSTNRNLTPAEQVESLIHQHLCEPGSRLLLIIPLQSNFSKIETALWKKEPGYLKIEYFDDWSKTSDKEGYYVLLSCIAREFTLAGNLNRCKKDLINIASDIERLKLRAVIPVRSDCFNNNKHEVLQFDLFKNLEPIETSIMI